VEGAERLPLIPSVLQNKAKNENCNKNCKTLPGVAPVVVGPKTGSSTAFWQ